MGNSNFEPFDSKRLYTTIYPLPLLFFSDSFHQRTNRHSFLVYVCVLLLLLLLPGCGGHRRKGKGGGATATDGGNTAASTAMKRKLLSSGCNQLLNIPPIPSSIYRKDLFCRFIDECVVGNLFCTRYA